MLEVGKLLKVVRQLGDILQIPILVYNEKGEVVYVNPALQELVDEIAGGEAFGKIFLDFVHPDDREKVIDAMKRKFAGEIVKPYTVRLRNKKGLYKSYLVVGGLVKCSEEKLAIVTLSDVTTFEEQKLMLLIINRALRHDVLNALTAATTYLEIAKDYCNEGEAATILQKLEMSMERAVKIIRNLRAFEEAVLEGKLEKIRVKEVVEEAARHFDVPITIEGDCEVIADRGLRVVFENLFQNAVQHGKTDRIEVKIKRVSDVCEIRVADYGCSIPDEIKDRVFDEGFAYGNAATTGYGLYLVKKLVDRYGGEVWVEDNKPKGAVFVIRLRA